MAFFTHLLPYTSVFISSEFFNLKIYSNTVLNAAGIQIHIDFFAFKKMSYYLNTLEGNDLLSPICNDEFDDDAMCTLCSTYSRLIKLDRNAFKSQLNKKVSSSAYLTLLGRINTMLPNRVSNN